MTTWIFGNFLPVMGLLSIVSIPALLTEGLGYLYRAYRRQKRKKEYEES